MIRSFKRKGLEVFFLDGDRSGIDPSHSAGLARIRDRLDASMAVQDMNLPGFKLHELKGKEKGAWAVSVSGNWRVVFFDLKAMTQCRSITWIIIKERSIDMIGKRKPVHPGEVLLENVIKPLGLTVTDAAARLGVTRKTLSVLLNGKASLSPEMAMRIASATNTSPESWLYMQAKLDLWNVAKKPPKVQELKSVAV